MTEKPAPKPLTAPREVRVKPHSYQPSKAEKDGPVKIEATPEQLARAVLRPVRIVEDPNA